MKVYLIAAISLLSLNVSASIIGDHADKLSEYRVKNGTYDLSLTPNDLINGLLPDGNKSILLSVFNGNWTDTIYLPKSPSKNIRVRIESSATFSFKVKHDKFDFDGMKVNIGNIYNFEFDTVNDKWELLESVQSPGVPSTDISIVDNSKLNYITFNISDGDWTNSIKLPENGNDDTIIVIKSNATVDSVILHDNVLAKSSLALSTGDRYKFIYNDQYKKWQYVENPSEDIYAKDVNVVIPEPKYPNTNVKFWNGNYTDYIELPYSGMEGDMIKLISDATYTAKISSKRTNLRTEYLVLQKGDVFEFTYNNSKWHLTKQPVKVIQAKDTYKELSLSHFKTKILSSDGNYKADLILPKNKMIGQRVIFESLADRDFSVHYESVTKKVRKNEIVSFIVSDNGKWTLETNTIDLLLLYSSKNIAKLGSEEKAKERLYEGLALTNESLENSSANFRFRLAHISKFESPEHWESLDNSLRGLQYNPDVKALKIKYFADGVYYEGTESGCGLAWANSSKDKMVATGSLNCGTTVMRHELGHNMGLHHGISDPNESTDYGVGYSKERTIMGGNGINYYSNPNIISPNTRLPLGFIDKIDGVRKMNKNSYKVSKYRENLDEQVILYEHGLRVGRSLYVSDNVPQLVNFNFNDMVSSIKIPKDWTITLYEDANYNGKSINLSESNNWLGDLNFNDIVSSIRVTKYTKTPDAHIAGYNNEHLTNVSREQCQVACSEQSWCQSLDYYNDSNACDLSDANAAEVGGLKVGKYGYDHYSIK